MVNLSGAYSALGLLLGLVFGLLLLASCGEQQQSQEPASVNRIVYVGNDSHIYTIAPDGTDRRQLTSGNSLQTWPTWSPDGARIVFTKISSDANAQPNVGLYYVDVADGTVHHLYTNEPSTGVLAPTTFHYIYWSPDSEKVSSVTLTPRVPNLFLYDIGNDVEPQRLIQNGPVYTSWSPDSRYILAHIQPFKELLLIDVQEDGSSQRVSGSVGRQLTPA